MGNGQDTRLETCQDLSRLVKTCQDLSLIVVVLFLLACMTTCTHSTQYHQSPELCPYRQGPACPGLTASLGIATDTKSPHPPLFKGLIDGPWRSMTVHCVRKCALPVTHQMVFSNPTLLDKLQPRKKSVVWTIVPSWAQIRERFL